jgi:hypothetical protein
MTERGNAMKILPKALLIGSFIALFVVSHVYVLATWDIKLVMQLILSLVLLAATLYVILSKSYQAKDKHWAYTTLGMVIGFWLKP